MGKIGVIVVAAGKGSRMRTKESKQFLLLQDKPVLVHTLIAFQTMDAISSIVLVTGSEHIQRCEAYVEQYGITKVCNVISGGAQRQDSVFRGLQALPEHTEWVLVHDGVRPFINEEMVMRCLHQAFKHEAAVLAVPVKDTIKQIHASGVIEATPDRRSLWAIQTPQAFRRLLLLEAHETAQQAQFVGTDDAMLVERLGVPVHVVEGDYRNIKITTPEDLSWAEFLLQQEREGKQ